MSAENITLVLDDGSEAVFPSACVGEETGTILCDEISHFYGLQAADSVITSTATGPEASRPVSNEIRQLSTKYLIELGITACDVQCQGMVRLPDTEKEIFVCGAIFQDLNKTGNSGE